MLLFIPLHLPFVFARSMSNQSFILEYACFLAMPTLSRFLARNCFSYVCPSSMPSPTLLPRSEIDRKSPRLEPPHPSNTHVRLLHIRRSQSPYKPAIGSAEPCTVPQ